MSTSFDQQMMLRCLELAKSAEGRTSPNPLVGAVVLDENGSIAGEGFHERAGQAHAEVIALEAAGQRAQNGTLYVNLEPCSHFGRTPPCAERVIASGIRRVVVGMQDPNPKVFGDGIRKLKEANITVEISELERECRELNRAFVKRITIGLPWLILKMASTLDGRIADRFGKSRWISGSEARAFVHRLRNLNDCVLIGGSTAVSDDPELNVRDIEGGRDPHRAVLDPTLQISPKARLCQHAENSSAWTVIFSNADKIKAAPEYPHAVRLIDPLLPGGKESLLHSALKWLADHDVQSVLCEGGGRLAAACMEEHLVDEVCWILAPKFFTDAFAIPSLAGQLATPVDHCIELQDVCYEQLGRDILVRGKPLWKS